MFGNLPECAYIPKSEWHLLGPDAAVTNVPIIHTCLIMFPSFYHRREEARHLIRGQIHRDLCRAATQRGRAFGGRAEADPTAASIDCGHSGVSRPKTDRCAQGFQPASHVAGGQRYSGQGVSQRQADVRVKVLRESPRALKHSLLHV